MPFRAPIKGHRYSRQRGVVLIALMLLLIVGSSAVLLTRLNSQNGSDLIRQQASLELLREARDALIGYAGGHPEYPGALPWPDRGDDNNHDGNSDCSSVSFTPALMLGRLPILGTSAPCDLYTGLNLASTTEANGGIWYAVSRNLLHNHVSDDYASLNWDSLAAPDHPWLTVRDASGAIISDQVAFVLMIGNPPIGNQNRSPADADYLDADNYLDSITIGANTWSNADADGCYDDNSGCGGSDGEDFIIASEEEVINDLVLYVTADQIIEIIETRVAADIRDMLEQYYTTFNRYPWLTPHLAAIGGEATAGSGGLTLEDTDMDFVDFGVRPGDTLVNESDGSSGEVATVTATTLTVTSLTGGSGSFSSGDEYRLQHYIDPRDTALSATALTASGQTVFAGSVFDFFRIGVSPGDWIHNLADGSWGPLADPFTSTNFDEGELTADVLEHGTANTFSPGNTFLVTRQNSIEGTRTGHLPLHETNGAFPTGFSAAWALPVAFGFNLTTSSATLANPDSDYINALEAVAQTTVSTGALPIDASEGSCVWVDIDTARCAGSVSDAGYRSGTASADASGPTPVLVDDDAGVDFSGIGVLPGDQLRNTSDGSTALITVVGSDTLGLADVHNGAANDITTGDNYSIDMMTEKVSGTVVNVYSFGVTQYETNIDLAALGVQAGDYILNTTTGQYSRLRQVGSSGFPFFLLEAAFNNGFTAGDSFEVRFHPVMRRAYTMEFAFSGTGTPVTNARYNGGKARDVSVTAGAVGSLTSILIEDFDDVGLPLATTELTNPASSSGDILLTSIQYDFDTSRNDAYELPAWIRDNGWHRSVLVAISAGHVPDGAGFCTEALDCLEVANVENEDNKRLVVIYNGRELAGQTRTDVQLADFFEGENADDDDADGSDDDGDFFDTDLNHRFQQSPLSTTFNDRTVFTDGP